MSRTYYKLEVQGIVYLVDTETSNAYLYDPTSPTEIGKVIWNNPQEKPVIQFLSNWKEIVSQKFDATATELPTA